MCRIALLSGLRRRSGRGDIEASERELTNSEGDAGHARALSPRVVSGAQLQQAETAVATARARLQGLQTGKRRRNDGSNAVAGGGGEGV